MKVAWLMLCCNRLLEGATKHAAHPTGYTAQLPFNEIHTEKDPKKNFSPRYFGVEKQ
jgi:hypothetical protein